MPDGISSKNSTIPNNDFKEFFELFETKQFQDELFSEIINNEGSVDKNYPLYVAKFSLKYKVPGQFHNEYDGFRPLGSKVAPPEGYYEYTFKNFITGGDSGLNIEQPSLSAHQQSSIKKIDHDLNHNYYVKHGPGKNITFDYGLRICVKAPADYNKNVEWEDINAGKAMTNEQLKKWIVTDSKVPAPSLDDSATIFDEPTF